MRCGWSRLVPVVASRRELDRGGGGGQEQRVPLASPPGRTHTPPGRDRSPDDWDGRVGCRLAPPPIVDRVSLPDTSMPDLTGPRNQPPSPLHPPPGRS